MLYFPQLSSGSVAQYPVTRTSVTRSVVNRMPDESAVCLADPDAGLVRWDLRYSSLNDAERAALEALFCASGGPLRTFTFLDPASNLLRWSEDFSREVWVRDGLLQVSDGRLVNAAQTIQGMEQSVAGPGWYRYCFSALVRGGFVRMSLANADGRVESERRAGDEWMRVWCSGEISGESEKILCRIEIEPGAVVEVREMLLVAQPMPGGYRVSRESGGVYGATRFDQERLEFRADGRELHSVAVRLVSRV